MDGLPVAQSSTSKHALKARNFVLNADVFYTPVTCEQ